MNKKYNVVGIGSPLLDIIVNVDDEVLSELGLEKGEMRLISEEESEKILEYIENHDKIMVSGGSVANTIAGVSLLGNNAALIGLIGNDEHGDLYEKHTQDSGVHSLFHRHDDKCTGHAITFITSDGERTFATHLGAAADIRGEHIAEDKIKEGKILHVEAYQLEDPTTREIVLSAVDIAKKSGAKVSLDLSDPWLIERMGDLLEQIVNKHVDIVFANESEAEKFTGLNGEDAVERIAEMCDVAVVKLGKNGSLIKSGGKLYRINPYAVEAVNTNGAGDAYAAGVLHGIANELEFEEMGKIASHVAALVVASPGAKMDEKHHDEIEGYRVSN